MRHLTQRVLAHNPIRRIVCRVHTWVRSVSSRGWEYSTLGFSSFDLSLFVLLFVSDLLYRGWAGFGNVLWPSLLAAGELAAAILCSA